MQMFNTMTFLLCDRCADVADECNSSRRDLWDEASGNGWKRVHGHHWCPKCVAEAEAPNARPKPNA